jgi:hypothetical protein
MIHEMVLICLNSVMALKVASQCGGEEEECEECEVGNERKFVFVSVCVLGVSEYVVCGSE